MRTIDFEDVTVQIPNYAAFLRDNNLITVKSEAGNPVAAEIKITRVGGEYVNLEYTSEQPFLAFQISDSATSLIGDQPSVEVSYALKIYEQVGGEWQTRTGDGVQYGSVFYRGQTLNDRYHGSETVIPMLPNQTSVDIYMPFGGNYRVNSEQTQVSVNGGVVHVQSSEQGSRVVFKTITETYGNPVTTGDLNGIETGYTKTRRIAIQKPAKCESPVYLSYFNSDGCKRYVIGNFQQTKVSAETIGYRRNVLVRDTPLRKVGTVTRESEVAFYGVPYGQYLTDILISDRVEFSLDGENWTPCAVTDSEVTEIDRLQNITLKIKTIG